jgi:tetratricopeptide (TPR) repeat protein
MPNNADNTRATFEICLLLALVTLIAYWGIFSSEFVNYDDPYYVIQNQSVQSGLSWNGLCWAFTTRACDNWHPLTWISLMLDYNLYGLDSAGFHATNLVLHIFNSILLFLLLQYITGARWRSAFVAALFALHPLHVESVAWIAERKDVLSTFFAMLTLCAYARYVEKPGIARYWPVLLLFALGLMAKPMLVTLPFLLLLLDFWPLRRMPLALNFFGRQIRIADAEEQVSFGRWSLGKLVVEKVPLLALSVVSSGLTIWAQTQAIAMAVPLTDRLLNAALSYVRYMVKMVWPIRLYVNYPYPHGWPIWYPVIAVIIAGYLSVVAVRESRRHPYLLTGWFWFFIALIPVIGLVQVGIQSIADRYTYVPLIGLFIIITWLGCDLAKTWRLPPALLRILATATIAACILATMIQVGYWKNSFALFEHALRLNPNNFFAEVNLAMSYEAKEQHEPALEHLIKATRINPNFGETYNKMGGIQLWLGNYADAIESFNTALRLNASAPLAHYGLALAYEKQDKLNEAAEQVQTALTLAPGNQEYIDEYNLIAQKSGTNPVNAAPPNRQ